ncbi:MAG: hypothetical protein ACI9KS_002562 [Sulfitobacter sp.]|jgi:hypothetical protein
MLGWVPQLRGSLSISLGNKTPTELRREIEPYAHSRRAVIVQDETGGFGRQTLEQSS